MVTKQLHPLADVVRLQDLLNELDEFVGTRPLVDEVTEVDNPDIFGQLEGLGVKPQLQERCEQLIEVTTGVTEDV